MGKHCDNCRRDDRICAPGERHCDECIRAIDRAVGRTTKEIDKAPAHRPGPMPFLPFTLLCPAYTAA